MYGGINRFGLAIVSAVCAVAVAGCGSKAQTSAQASATTDSAPASAAASGTEQSASSSTSQESAASNSKYAVTIDNARLVADYEGNPAVAIDFTFTNVSDEDAASMAVALNPEVYQGGTECSIAFTVDEDTGGYMKKVKKGASVPVTMVYSLNDTTTDVEVEVKELFSWDNTVLAQKVFSLGEGQE